MVERAIRLTGYLVLALLVVTGILLGASGDERMWLVTSILFGSCAAAIAWKLGSSRGEVVTARAAESPSASSAAEPDGVVPSGPWTVHGHDTFSREDYFIGAFDTEAEAREVARRKLEWLGRFQDPSLRDKIWVEPPDSEYRRRRYGGAAPESSPGTEE